jgi:PemK-like, MazF-like toxin of type II toxin-antitoxin system
MSAWRGLADLAVRQASRLLRGSGRGPARPRPTPPVDGRPRPTGTATATVRPPGAPTGRHLDYAPSLDGRADPGEVVWTWVPYEEDASHGKDRPVLVVGRDGGTLLGLMLSSQDRHEGDRDWLSLGAGAWDGEHRPSWVRLDRVIDVPETGIRREGAILDRTRFDQVAARLRGQLGWS